MTTKIMCPHCKAIITIGKTKEYYAGKIIKPKDDNKRKGDD